MKINRIGAVIVAERARRVYFVCPELYEAYRNNNRMLGNARRQWLRMVKSSIGMVIIVDHNTPFPLILNPPKKINTSGSGHNGDYYCELTWGDPHSKSPWLLIVYYTGWWFGRCFICPYFFIQLGMSSSQLTNSYLFREVGIPPTSHGCLMVIHDLRKMTGALSC